MSANENDKRDGVDRFFDDIIDPVVNRVANVLGHVHTPDKEYERDSGLDKLGAIEDAVIVNQSDVAGRVSGIDLVIHLGSKRVILHVVDIKKAQGIVREERITVGQWFRAVIAELESLRQLPSGEDGGK